MIVLSHNVGIKVPEDGVFGAYIVVFSFEKSPIVSSLLPELEPFTAFYDLP